MPGCSCRGTTGSSWAHHSPACTRTCPAAQHSKQFGAADIDERRNESPAPDQEHDQQPFTLSPLLDGTNALILLHFFPVVQSPAQNPQHPAVLLWLAVTTLTDSHLAAQTTANSRSSLTWAPSLIPTLKQTPWLSTVPQSVRQSTACHMASP